MKFSSVNPTKHLATRSELERLEPAHPVGKEKPVIVIDMTKVPTILKERWEDLGKAARNPAFKLRGVANLRDD